MKAKAHSPLLCSAAFCSDLSSFDQTLPCSVNRSSPMASGLSGSLLTVSNRIVGLSGLRLRDQRSSASPLTICKWRRHTRYLTSVSSGAGKSKSIHVTESGGISMSPPILRKRSIRSTNSTMPLSRSFRRIVNVLRSEFMAMNAMFFTIVLIPHSAKRVLSISHRFHMCWIDAIAYAAEMIDLSIFWNGTNQQLVTESVRTPHIAFESDCSVSRTIAATNPQPAASFPIDPDSGLNALRQNAKVEVSHNRHHSIRNHAVVVISLERQGY
jgi:hypothetical protein